MKRLIVDDRWHGEHGIGRFATEVLARLGVPFRTLKGELSPTNALDIFNPNRLRLGDKDVVFSPGFNAGITRARQILTLHDLIHLEVESEKKLLKTLYYNTVVRWAVRRAGVVMTVSETSARVIRSWLKSSNVEVVVVGCGRSKAFEQGGDRVDFATPTFLYVGNMKEHKNVGVVLDALANRPDYSLIVVTSDLSLATSMASASGVTDQVSIRHGISDSELATLYRGVTGVVQPSLLEGFGLPALEAMSCGTRVAYWAGCESVREICDGSGVEVAHANDIREWESALDSLTDEAKEGPLVMPGDWEARYSWDTVASKVSAVLDRQ